MLVTQRENEILQDNDKERTVLFYDCVVCKCVFLQRRVRERINIIEAF
jgi:hypothetical protein